MFIVEQKPGSRMTSGCCSYASAGPKSDSQLGFAFGGWLKGSLSQRQLGAGTKDSGTLTLMVK